MIGHLFDQGPSIAATLGLLVARKGAGLPDLPGPERTDTVPPRPASLVRDFVTAVGGDPARWEGRLPPHLFPQWGWPVLVRCLHGLPYDLTKAVNAGFRWESRAPLPADEPLELSARLTKVDDDGRRVLLEVELTTGTASAPAALHSTMVVYVPSPSKGKGAAQGAGKGGGSKERDPVPADALALATRDLPANLGWHFALLTGDFNPIHWIPLAGKAAGFGGVILHGFGTAAVAAETVIATRLDGDASRLRGMEARFVSPVKLPARVTISVRSPEDRPADRPDEGRHELYVGPAGGGPAQLVGAFHV